MGVTVIKRDYYNRFRSEKVDWLLGNVGDWQSLQLEVDVSIELTATQKKPIMLERGGLDWVLSDGSKWAGYGFDTGDTIKIQFNYELAGKTKEYTVTKKIALLMGERMRLENVVSFLNKDTMIPWKEGNLNVYSILIFTDKVPEGVELEYGHITNEDVEGGTLNSFIDGTVTRFIGIFEDIDYDDEIGNGYLTPVGLQSGMAIKQGLWSYKGKKGTHTYQFIISFEFMIASFFEGLENFETMTAPNQLFDAKSLTDNFKLKFFPEWNNPNMYVANVMKETERLGNTGWFNENFNGLNNNFKVESLTYIDPLSGSNLQGLSLSSSVRVKAVISGINNLQNGLTKSSIGFIFLPEDEEIYTKKETPYHQNLFLNTGGGLLTGVFTPSAIASNVEYTGFSNDPAVTMNFKNTKFEIVGGNLVFEADFIPSIGFFNYVDNLEEEDKNYALWLSVADQEKETNFSDRVSLLLDYNRFKKFVPPVGEFEPMSIGFFEHPQDENGLIKSGECGEFFVEDDLLARVDFKIDKNKPKPTKLEYVIEIENTEDGRKYELDRYSINLASFPVVNDVPMWDFDESRGFKYQEGNSKNFVKLKRNKEGDEGDELAYTGFYGFKIRWEDWIKRLGVPADFYNEEKENDGYSNDWANYLNKENWQIQFTVYTHTKIGEQSVKYVNEEIFTFKDYNSNETIEAEWAFIREADGKELPVSLNEKGEPVGILLNETMRLRVTYRKLGGSFIDIRNYYGTICVEEANGGGYKEFRQLSSLWGSEPDNPLKPLVGSEFVKMSGGLSDEIILECLVNPLELKKANLFKFSSRLGCLYDCENLTYDKNTKMFFYFDRSGSMSSTESPLNVMKDTILKDRLLKFYEDDIDLYNENVNLLTFSHERTFITLNMEGIEPPEGKVIVFVFQDEADNNYTALPNQKFKDDFETFMQRLNSFKSGYYRGAVFQVMGGQGVGSGDAWDWFRNMLKGVENNIAPYDLPYSLVGRNETSFTYDVQDGGTPQYYMDLIVQKLTDLGYNI